MHAVSTNLLLAQHQALVGKVADPEEAMASLRAEMEKAAEALERNHAVSVRRHVVQGGPVAAGLSGRTAWRLDYGYPMHTLEAEVDKARPDLLVFGKYGRSAVERWMVGSITAHLGRIVDCDMLVVPRESV